MKKLFFLLASGLILGACSVDSNPTETQTVDSNLTAQIAQDNTVYGNYKGVFTTDNSEFRATVEINIIKTSEGATSLTSTLPMATLYFPNGDVIVARASQPATLGAINNMVFSTNKLSFTFSVDADGQNGQVNNVTFQNLHGSILLAKDMQRAPITPITGTYACTNCGGTLGDGSGQTFNVMFTGSSTGNTTITSQLVLNGNTYNGVGVQNSCQAMGTSTVCSVASGDGSPQAAAFTTAGGRKVYFTGIHNYNNQPTGATVDCSGMMGNWTFEANGGDKSGTFKSDNQCALFTANFQQFTGTGFRPDPAVGQLDSKVYAITGLSDGALAFGGVATAGDFARGASAGNVTPGGIYAFTVQPGNIAFGIQPGTTDFTPGSVTIKIVNNTPSTYTSINVAATVWVNNNEERSSFLNLGYSLDNTTYTDVITTFNTPAASDTNGFVSSNVSKPVDISADPLAPGETMYIRLSSDDVSGSGSRDEFAIDDLIITGL